MWSQTLRAPESRFVRTCEVAGYEAVLLFSKPMLLKQAKPMALQHRLSGSDSRCRVAMPGGLRLVVAEMLSLFLHCDVWAWVWGALPAGCPTT